MSTASKIADKASNAQDAIDMAREQKRRALTGLTVELAARIQSGELKVSD